MSHSGEDSLHIIIIARHHGELGSGGARRPTLLASALREAGHTVSVVGPFESSHPDDITISHPAKIEDSTSLAGTPVASSSFAQQVKAWLRQWLLWPEPDIRWARKVIRELIKQDVRADVILTTSPPESVHWVGRTFKTRLGARWIADFRDTWTLSPHRVHVRGIRARLERVLARKWLRSVDIVVVVDSFIASDIKRLLPSSTGIKIIGHYSDIFDGKPIQLPAETFNLVHSGAFSLSDHRRPLEPLLQALTGCREDLCLHVAGRLTHTEKQALAEAPFPTRYHGLLTLQMSRALQAGADALLLYTPNPSDALPGKAAEYAMSGKPVVLVGDSRLANYFPSRVYDVISLRNLSSQNELPTPSSDELRRMVNIVARI